MTEREAPRSVLTSPSAAGGHNGAGAPHLGSNITPAADNRTTLARAAVAYARRGWPVLPCVPAGKIPLTRRGFHDATDDPEQVAKWWNAEPSANVATVPGRAKLSNGGTLMVIDVDGDAGREAARLLRVPDDTATVTTGRGEHRYFRVPEGVRLGNRALAPNLDVRHAAGYVLLPPSVHPSGAVYRWQRPPKDGSVLILPSRLLERLTARREVVKATEPQALFPPGAAAWRRVEAYLRRLPSGLSDGEGRNNAGFRLALFLLHEVGLPEPDAQAVLAAWNADHVHPLAAGELSSILRSAARQGGRRAP